MTAQRSSHRMAAETPLISPLITDLVGEGVEGTGTPYADFSTTGRRHHRLVDSIATSTSHAPTSVIEAIVGVFFCSRAVETFTATVWDIRRCKLADSFSVAGVSRPDQSGSAKNPSWGIRETVPTCNIVRRICGDSSVKVQIFLSKMTIRR